MLRRICLVALSIGFVVGVPAVALASNSHTVGEWYHGLGDGSDNDNYLHPFNHNNNGHSHSNKLGLQHNTNCCGVLDFSQTMTASHHHRDWDATGVGECRYTSIHESQSYHSLNYHKHKHHNFCG